MQGTMQRAAILLGLCLVCSLGASAQNLKIGVMDEDRLRDKFTQLREALDKLESDVGAKQKEFDDMQQTLVDEKKKLDLQKSLKPDDAALKQKEKDLFGKLQDLRELMVDANRDLSKRKLDVLKTFTPHIQKAVDKVATDNSYDLILKRSDTYYFSVKVDVTDLVLAELERMGPVKMAPIDASKPSGGAGSDTGKPDSK